MNAGYSKTVFEQNNSVSLGKWMYNLYF
jgi:hypothetical protein